MQPTLHPPLINFKKERNFSEKLNATFAFLSQNFRPIGKNLLLIAGPFALLMGVFYGIYQSYTFGAAFSNPGSNPWEGSNLTYLVIGYVGMILFSFIATTMVVAITMRHIRVYMEEGHTYISTGYLWSTIWRDFFRALGTSVYIGILAIASILLLAIPAGAMSIGGGPNPVVIGLILLFGFFALLIFWPSLLLLYPIRNMEKANVFSATGRLFKLISGKWLSTSGLVIVVTIIISVMSVVFAIPMYIIMFIKFFHSIENADFAMQSPFGTDNILLILASGLLMLGSFALYSILFVAITLQYFNLVERKEAKGLIERMESFGRERAEPDDREEQY